MLVFSAISPRRSLLINAATSSPGVFRPPALKASWMFVLQMLTAGRSGTRILKRYLPPTNERRRKVSFLLFVVSADGLLGREASPSWRENGASHTQRQVCGFVRAHVMSIAVVRSTHHCLRGGSWIPTSQIAFQRPPWEDQAGLGLLFH